jgi:hypothetical protein
MKRSAERKLRKRRDALMAELKKVRSQLAEINQKHGPPRPSDGERIRIYGNYAGTQKRDQYGPYLEAIYDAKRKQLIALDGNGVIWRPSAKRKNPTFQNWLPESEFNNERKSAGLS